MWAEAGIQRHVLGACGRLDRVARARHLDGFVLLPACWLDGCCEVLNEPPGMVLQLPPGKAGFFRDDSHLQLFQEGRRNLKR